MKKINCFVGLGGNQDNPLKQLKLAITALSALPQTRLVKQSGLYQSEPLKSSTGNNSQQQNYLNAVVKLETTLALFNLLHQLQQIESNQGRKRDLNNRWGPRTLDLDILLYGDKVIHTQQLTIPHYAIKDRDFVLSPLIEIAPDLLLPDRSKPARLLQQCENNNLKLINNSV